MKKRGMGSAVDWIIAVGIFVIYFGLVFVFFKPGVGSDFNADSLLSIVEENFMEKGSWELTKRIIFIEGANLDGQKKVVLSQSGEELNLHPYKYSLFEIQEDIKLDEDKSDKTGADNALDSLGDSGSEKTQIEPYKVGGDLGLKIKIKGADEEEKVLIIQSTKNLDNFIISEAPNENSVKKLCRKQELDLEDNDCNGKYALGASEILRGLYLGNAWGEEKQLIDMLGMTYSELKEDWKFPQFKDFRILLYSPSEGIGYALAEEDQTKHFVIGDQVPPVDADINIRQFNSFILSEDGAQIPVTVHIMVW